MNKKRAYLIFLVFSLVGIIFLMSYTVSLKYLGKQKVDPKVENSKPVYNSNANTVNDKVNIVLKTKTKDGKFAIDKTLSYEELKKEVSNDDPKKQDIIDFYGKLNYKIESFDENNIVLIRDSIKVLKSNAYYLGEKDGFIAIYKTNDKGEATVENAESDISVKKVDSLKDVDKQKIINFQKEFKTKEEAEEALSGYTS
ncbi:hypothetical protein SAMN02745163_00044 [Clostridium cavendishii DSM 21758]|uniref:BofC C-terminal domain-containing protein n=1 Tax=Clostridium cavendishii DSM 21758 TaxID=1121302 RepID=A0A1M6ACC2_9CLOT|nr:hypothetical protein [Clostridium cavendishii]SHI34038.1 hypothetical protein SAMN02745163_00044 [Clostridium cavendishii DSM 21758]